MPSALYTLKTIEKAPAFFNKTSFSSFLIEIEEVPSSLNFF